MLLKKVKTVEQKWNVKYTRCGYWIETVKWYFCGLLVYSYNDEFTEQYQTEETTIGFKK